MQFLKTGNHNNVLQHYYFLFKRLCLTHWVTGRRILLGELELLDDFGGLEPGYARVDPGPGRCPVLPRVNAVQVGARVWVEPQRPVCSDRPRPRRYVVLHRRWRWTCSVYVVYVIKFQKINRKYPSIPVGLQIFLFISCTSMTT